MDKQLVFRVSKQHFAIPIEDTDKIIRMDERTIFPDVSSYILGVQDVEGTILPLVNLADRFYNEALEDEETADVIVVNWKDEKIGLVVDEVIAVQTIEQEKWTDTNDSNEKVDGVSTSYISFFIQTEDGIIPMLNVHALFNDEKAGEIRQLLKIEGVKH